MTSKANKLRPLFACGLAALLAPTPPLAGQVGDFVAAVSRNPNASHSIHTVDVTTLPPAVHGPFFESTFDFGFRLILLRDAPVGIVFGGGPRLHRIDFSDPESPSVADTVTLPFTVNDLTRLGDARDELVAVGSGGQLAVIDPETLGIVGSFSLPSARSRVRTSRDGRLLLTQVASPSMAFLASFDSVLGPGAEVPMRVGTPVDMDDVVFSPDSRTAAVMETECFIFGLTGGPNFCETRLQVYDLSSPATPQFREELGVGIDALTSVVADRAGQRLIFHRRGNQDVVSEHQLRPFSIAGLGDLTAEGWVDLVVGGDFELGGMVRTAGAKRLLVFTSVTQFGQEPVARLHHLDSVSGSGPSYLLPLPLEPRAVFHTGADIFADGFETGGTGAWSAAF